MKNNRHLQIAVLKNTIFLVVGTLVLAFATGVFILPMSIVGGGISGIAIVLNTLISSELFGIDTIVFFLTWGSFFIGLWVLGKSFALKTLISALIYPSAVSLFLRLADPSILGGFFYMSGYAERSLALILSAAVGGALVGVGCALTFIGGGSTGGVDIIAFCVCKAFPRFKSPKVIFFIDAFTITLGAIVIGDLVITMLGILSALASAIMVDRVFMGGNIAFVAQIITDKDAEISAYVIEKMKRTTTVATVKGGFSGEDKRLVMISFTRSQYAELLSAIGRFDPRAFIIINRAHEISGRGWR